MSVIAAVIMIVAMAGGLVVFTMVVENWEHIVQPLHTRAPRPVARSVEAFRVTPNPVPTPPVARSLPVLHTRAIGPPTPDRGLSVRAITATGGALHLRDTSVPDTSAAVLFAAYAAGTYRASGRVGAWITVAETPPSADPKRFAPGVDLRDKRAKVAELLTFDDDHRVWVGLNPEVDIGRGLRRAPVPKGTLRGLVLWWEHTRCLPAVIEPSDVAEILASMRVIGAELDGTPWQGPVAAMVEGLTHAMDRGESLLVDLSENATSEPGPTGRSELDVPDGGSDSADSENQVGLIVSF